MRTSASGGGLVMLDLTDNAGTVHHLAVGAGKDAKHLCRESRCHGKYPPSAAALTRKSMGSLGKHLLHARIF